MCETNHDQPSMIHIKVGVQNNNNKVYDSVAQSITACLIYNFLLEHTYGVSKRKNCSFIKKIL